MPGDIAAHAGELVTDVGEPSRRRGPHKVSKTSPDPKRVAAAKKGWETRRTRQERQEVERATSAPSLFYPGEGRIGITPTSSYVSPRVLLDHFRSWQYIAVRAISDRIMALEPVVTTQVTVSDGTVLEEELDDHPLKLVLDNPNPLFSRMQILRIVSLWLSQVGDAYLLKIVDGMGVPRELHPLSPASIQKKVGPIGIEGYVYYSESGEKTEYAPDEIVRIFNPDPACPFEGVGNLGPQVVS